MVDELLGEIELDESPIPATCIRRLDEVTIKRDGCVWRIHKNDADPFPSNPHAHNVESGLKLDLRNGDLYFQNKPTNENIGKKHLSAVQDSAVKKGIPLPPIA